MSYRLSLVRDDGLVLLISRFLGPRSFTWRIGLVPTALLRLNILVGEATVAGLCVRIVLRRLQPSTPTVGPRQSSSKLNWQLHYFGGGGGEVQPASAVAFDNALLDDSSTGPWSLRERFTIYPQGNTTTSVPCACWIHVQGCMYIQWAIISFLWIQPWRSWKLSVFFCSCILWMLIRSSLQNHIIPSTYMQNMYSTSTAASRAIFILPKAGPHISFPGRGLSTAGLRTSSFLFYNSPLCKNMNRTRFFSNTRPRRIKEFFPKIETKQIMEVESSWRHPV